tara:strand:- start:429 stop:836 length:408 start_codon:yes stop_codon:yes gene_type:complete
MCIIEERLEEYVEILSQLEMLDRYTWLMDFGRKSIGIKEEERLREFEVPGCQSATWLIPMMKDNKIHFKADSVALITKGMVSLLADIFSDTTKDDIKGFNNDSLEKLDLRTLLTPGRRNGVYNMLLKIKRMGEPN